MSQEKILIIKLSALGDFIQSLGASKAIRKAHPDAHITLLTTRPFENFARESGYFDRIHIDKRPKFYNLLDWLDLRTFLNRNNFTRVYDLQNNDRSCFYFRLLNAPKPEWVGVARGASHCNTNPTRTAYHAFDGIKQTLALAGIHDVQPDPLDYITADLSGFELTKPYVLLVPGCAPSRPEKRWSAKHYAHLASQLISKGYQPVLLGTKDDLDATDYIAEKCPESLDLNSQTSLSQIIVLARGAAGAIGNDTGPMHMIAPTGCPSLALFSSSSNPVKHCPLGPNVQHIQKDEINDITVKEVMEQLSLCS